MAAEKVSMTLHHWINFKTVKVVANMLEVEEATVRYWRSYHALPRPLQMRAIKRASRGLVTYEIMIDTFLKNNAGKEGI